MSINGRVIGNMVFAVIRDWSHSPFTILRENRVALIGRNILKLIPGEIIFNCIEKQTKINLLK